ncbi:MAG TPA: NYN domain-containing protein [Halothiobacillaceae bacterium]|nr:NYN domain-containing protein [Halothiobacillaceae bacterium]
MAKLVYVDNSNLFIEGKRVKAVHAGLAADIGEAIGNRIFYQSYKIDFGKLHDYIAGTDKSEIKRCMLFGSRPPSSDTIWNIAKRAGFEVITEDRNVANKEKKIDTNIVANMFNDAYTITDKSSDTITLVAGDADFVPSVRILVENGFNVEVAFWGHASRELKEVCSKFINLNPGYPC